MKDKKFFFLGIVLIIFFIGAIYLTTYRLQTRNVEFKPQVYGGGICGNYFTKSLCEADKAGGCKWVLGQSSCHYYDPSRCGGGSDPWNFCGNCYGKTKAQCDASNECGWTDTKKVQGRCLNPWEVPTPTLKPGCRIVTPTPIVICK